VGSSIVGGVFEQEVFFSYKEGREYGFWRLLFFFYLFLLVGFETTFLTPAIKNLLIFFFTQFDRFFFHKTGRKTHTYCKRMLFFLSI